MALLKVRDECTKLIGHRFLNSHICLIISLAQLMVCFWAVAQHINSYLIHSKILKCDFLEGSLPLEAVDAVIFDVRLFHYLWGIRGCVAEYLDGGFGRLIWCISHSTSLICSIPSAFLSHPKPCYFWPLLVQQSAYGICLLVLLLAALPRIVIVLAQPQAAPLAPIFIYFFGTGLNFFLLYVYWHWYWHVSSMWNSVVRVKFGERLINANNRSRRDKPIRIKEEIDDAVLHFVPQQKMIGNEIIEDEPKIILPTSSTRSTQLDFSPASDQHQSQYFNNSSTSASQCHPNQKIKKPQISRNSRRAIFDNTNDYDDDDYDDYVDDYDSGGGDDEAEIDDEIPNQSTKRPIYATRLDQFSYENQRNQNQRILKNKRRILPPTPNLPMHGEIPRNSMLLLPNSRL